MNPSLTIFKNIFDNKTDKSMKFRDWDSFEGLLYDLSKKEGYKPKRGEFTKKASPLISPAVFPEDSKRRNENVIEWGGWAALDVDEYEGTFEDALRVFEDYYFVCYSSASSRKEHTKFRIIFPTLSPVKADKIRHFWYALNTEFKSLGDKQTKDLSRMYYVPAKYPGANNFIFTHKAGKILDPNVIMGSHEYINKTDSFSPEIMAELERYRSNTLTNTSYSWSSYHDCPFVNKKMINEYRALSGGGWYSKMFSILCATAANAVKMKYPLTASELEIIARGIDNDTGQWYKSRPLKLESQRALRWAMTSL